MKKNLFATGLILVLLGLCPITMTNAAEKPSGTAAATKATAQTWVIAVNQAPNQVRAFGMDLLYPASVLSFQKGEKGSLLKKGFGYFGINEVAPGRIRIGGMEPGKHTIPPNADGHLVKLTFRVKKQTPPNFKIVAVKDDMKTWPISTNNDHSAEKSVLTVFELEPPRPNHH